jgi:hypothetical protein
MNPSFYEPEFIWTQVFMNLSLWTQVFMNPNLYEPKFYEPEFMNQSFYEPKFIWTQVFINPSVWTNVIRSRPKNMLDVGHRQSSTSSLHVQEWKKEKQWSALDLHRWLQFV